MSFAVSIEKKPRLCVMPPCAGQRFALAHKFPREDYRTREWLDAINLPHLNALPYSKLRTSQFICSRHFRKTDYRNAISHNLNKTAIPSVNLKKLDQLHLVYDTVRTTVDEAPYPYPKQPKTVEVISEERRLKKIDLRPLKYMKMNVGDRAATGTVENIYQIIHAEEDEQTETEGDSYNGESATSLQVVTNDQDEEMTHEMIGTTDQFTLENAIPPTDYPLQTGAKELEEQVTGGLTEEALYEEDMAKLSGGEENEAMYSSVEKQPDMSANLLEIHHPAYPKNIHLDHFWLRDHCRCAQCYNTETNQRKFDITDIPLDIKALKTEHRDDHLWVKWSDDHESQYDLDWLFKSQECPSTSIVGACETMLWDQETVHEMDYSRVNFNAYLTNEDVAKTVVKSLLEFGFAFIEKVPPNVNMTEAAVTRLFRIQKTFFGEMWSFSDQKDHNDTAYSKQYLGSHTDNTYWNDAAGLQVFHCIKHTGSGGETFLVDGFKVLNDLQVKDPEAYEQLSRVDVPAEFIEGDTHYKHSAPIIRLDVLTQRPQQIRYNVYDRTVFNSLPQSEMSTFYRNFRSLAEQVNSEDNQWRFKLNPGTVLIFDNWRVLHGREMYTGKRQMTGCYVARDEFLNVARGMGLIS